MKTMCDVSDDADEEGMMRRGLSTFSGAGAWHGKVRNDREDNGRQETKSDFFFSHHLSQHSRFLRST